jgi:VanZ family protein
LAQQRYLPSRVPSLADVEHNGLGGLIGALLGWPFARAVRLTGRGSGRRYSNSMADQPTQILTRR